MSLSLSDSVNLILMIAVAVAGDRAGASGVVGRRDGGGDECSIGQPDEALGGRSRIEIGKAGDGVSSGHVGIVIIIITITTIVISLTHFIK